MTAPEPAFWKRLHAPTTVGAGSRDLLRRRFDRVRSLSERLMAPLLPDDFRIQSMPDVSPPYWNLGHTSWFFDRNVLGRYGRRPAGFDGLDYALNSYYEGLGPRLPREHRGQVASPSTVVVRDYRAAVDDGVRALLADADDAQLAELAPLLAIGCQHEQQHQELFVTEILHIRWSAPEQLRRGYLEGMRQPERARDPGPLHAIDVAGGETTIGFEAAGRSGGADFCWDNELPAHRTIVGDFALANRLVSNAEWCAFVADGGYHDPLLWLSNGWHWRQQHGIEAPLYWQRDGARWLRFSLYGLHELDPHAPVCHVSFYEADAFARWFAAQHDAWRSARLPRESEWEHAAKAAGFDRAGANLLDDDLAVCAFDVRGAEPGRSGLQQLAGSAWEWQQSHYEPYPGYRPFDGALTEYNGKFMDNQRVLRGGSFATPRAQARVTYRNFWAPNTRFQASSLRLLLDR